MLNHQAKFASLLSIVFLATMVGCNNKSTTGGTTVKPTAGEEVIVLSVPDLF